MSGVEFDEDKYGMARPGMPSGSSYPAKKNSAMGEWLIKHRLAKSDKSANAILIIVIIINIIITVFVYKFLT